MVFSAMHGARMVLPRIVLLLRAGLPRQRMQSHAVTVTRGGGNSGGNEVRIKAKSPSTDKRQAQAQAGLVGI